MSTIAIDWDDTLVGYKKYGEPKEWLPGAQEGLRALLKSGRDVVIHSCRATWGEGYIEVEEKLIGAGFGRFLASGKLRIWNEPGKPLAALYLDDRGLRFEGDWTDLLPTLRRLS